MKSGVTDFRRGEIMAGFVIGDYVVWQSIVLRIR